MAGDHRDDRRNETEWHYPLGRYIDSFTAGEQPGVVMIGAGGAAFIRDLAEGESLLVKPPALLFKDTTVNFQLHVEYPRAIHQSSEVRAGTLRIARVDELITPKHLVYARYTYKNKRVTNPPTDSSGDTSSPLVGTFSSPEVDSALTVAYNWVISPSLVNEARGGFSRTHTNPSFAGRYIRHRAGTRDSEYALDPFDAGHPDRESHRFPGTAQWRRGYQSETGNHPIYRQPDLDQGQTHDEVRR